MPINLTLTPYDRKFSGAFRITRNAVGLAGAVALIAILPGAASAQTYIGDGQALNVGINILSGVAGASITTLVAGPLNPVTGGSYSVGPEVKAGTLLLVNGGLPILDTGLIVDASALNATTVGASSAVTSTATVANVASPGAVDLKIGVSVLGGAEVDFITAKAIETITTATAVGGRNSTTVIDGLKVTDLLGNVQSAVVHGSTVALDGSENLTFTDSDSMVGLSISGLATIDLHEEVNNADTSRTTNAIDVSLLSGGGLGSIGDAKVLVSSSTAGFTSSGAAAPEPGSLALLLPIVAGGGFAARRRSRRSQG